MPVTWSLEYAGTTQSLAAWGIDRAYVNRVNLDTETLRFSIPKPVGGIYADPTFALDATVKLYRDDVCWFIGKIRQQPAAFGGGSERQFYVAKNAWHEMTRLIYQQQYTIPNADNTARLGSWSSRVVLGQNQFGTKISADTQIYRIGSYAAGAGGGLLTLADLPNWAQPVIEVARDISCAEAIRRMVAYAPDSVGYFTYSTGATVLSIKQRSALTSVDLDLAAADHVELIEGLDPLSDLVPTGVVLVFQTTEELEDGSTVLRETRQTAGTTRGVGVIFATVPLADGEAVPTGIASQYYSSLQTLQWQGSIRYKERDCSGLLRPGVTVNLLNGRTPWATMEATVQSTTEDLFFGVTTVELGSAGHLGLSDFADIMRRWRERQNPGTFPNTQVNGTEGVTDQETGVDPALDEESPLGEDPDAGGAVGGDPEVDPEEQTPNPDSGAPAGLFQSVDIVVCDGGTERTVRVVGFKL